jgi:hypothetical protein
MIACARGYDVSRFHNHQIPSMYKNTPTWAKTLTETDSGSMYAK